MKQGLKFALREEIFPIQKHVSQNYPFNKTFLLFFLQEFLEEEDDLDEDDLQLLHRAIAQVKEENYQLHPQHKKYYNGLIENHFRKECLGLKQADSNSLTPTQLKECLQFSQDDLVRLQATQKTSELLIFDLMTGGQGL